MTANNDVQQVRADLARRARNALGLPCTVADIEGATGLTANGVRDALAELAARGEATVLAPGGVISFVRQFHG